MTKNETFTCVMCNRVLPKGWTETEAEEELARNWPGISKAQCETVCDDCYEKHVKPRVQL
jgi:hypothetical protein